MFRKLFGGGTPNSSAYEVGQQLFQQAMNAASEYRTAEAIALYTKSFEANRNPAPLINRAKLYRWRILFEEAIRDLEIAKQLDTQQGGQFSKLLDKELRECNFLAQHRLGEKRDLFVTDLRSRGFEYVAGRIADTVFEGNGQILGYHMVNEVDNVKKFESLPDFPSAKTLLANWMKDQSVIDQALADPHINGDYQRKRILFETLVCVYDYADMAKVRDTIVRMIWCLLNPPSQIQALWEFGLRNSIS